MFTKEDLRGILSFVLFLCGLSSILATLIFWAWFAKWVLG